MPTPTAEPPHLARGPEDALSVDGPVALLAVAAQPTRQPKAPADHLAQFLQLPVSGRWARRIQRPVQRAALETDRCYRPIPAKDISMHNRDNPPARGERAAKIGYHLQDRLSAHAILTSLRRDTLEWVRLADVTAGRVDDFQLGSPARVDGYQIKWTFDGGQFTYRELLSTSDGNPPLIAQLADGWTRLSAHHPQHRAVVHLQTNRVPSVSKLIQIAGATTRKSFSQFLSEVWRPVRSRNAPIPRAWTATWDDLRHATSLSPAKFLRFVHDCELEFGAIVPSADSLPDPDFALQRDLVQLTDQLQALAADPTRPRDQPIHLDRKELLALLNWTHRLEFVSRHEFPAPTVYREISETAGRLRVAIQHLNGGYLVLLGDPGSGKSTLLTKTLVDLPYRLIRYYAFVPDARAPSSTRGEAANFLHDLTIALDRAGFRTNGGLSDLHVSRLLDRLYRQFALLHKDWLETGRKTLILVDGLDHIPREQRPQRSLLTILPNPNHIPDGVLFVLGSQTDQLTDVVASVQQELLRPDRRIEMGRLSRIDVASIADSARPDLSLTTKQHDALFALVSGHPLALSIILNRLSDVESSTEATTILESSATFHGQIDSVYFGHWRQLIEDPDDREMKRLLGRLARLRRPVDLQWVSRWASTDVVDQLRLKWYHLFSRQHPDRWNFFHNSFRQFLLTKTAEVPRRGADPVRDREIHADLAQLCAAQASDSPWSWDEAYHRQLAGQHDQVLELVDTSRLQAQLCAFRPVDEIDTDLRLAVHSAGVRRDFVGLCRILFAGMEFSSRKDNLSHLALHERLFELGERDLAIQHVHDGTKPRIDPASALEFSIDLFHDGATHEAKQIFGLCEPVDLLKSAVDGSDARDLRQEDVNRLRAWAKTAAQYRPLNEVLRLIRAARRDGVSDGEPSAQCITLQTSMIYGLAAALIEDRKWKDVSALLREIEHTAAATSSRLFWLYDRAWRCAGQSNESERARFWLDMAQRACPEASLTDAQRIALAEGVLRVLEDEDGAAALLKATAPPAPLRATTFAVGTEAFMPRFRRHRLMYVLGDRRSASELIPDCEHSREQPFVYVERGVSEIARLWAAAWDGNRLSGASFVAQCALLLRLFDNRPDGQDEGRHSWYTLRAGRADFYALLARCAQGHGRDAVQALAEEFENVFSRDDYQGWPITALVVALVDVGATDNWAQRVLGRVEQVHRAHDDGEPSERVSWRNDLAEAWSLVGCRDRARNLTREALRLSAGTGSRKDYQLDEWIKWMRKANVSDPGKSVERIRTMLGAVVGVAEYAAGRMTESASTELIRGAMEWSPVGTVRLSSTLAEKGAASYVHAARTMVIEALKTNCAAYQIAVAMVAHLLIPISTDGDSELLKQLVSAAHRHGGRSSVDRCVSALRYAIDVLALPCARVAWRSGLQEGLFGCDLNPSEFGISAAGDVKEVGNSDTYGRLVLDGGTTMAPEAVIGTIKSPADFYRLLDREAAESGFDWASVVSELAASLDRVGCGQLSSELRRRLADGTGPRRRQAAPLLVVAERQVGLGDTVGAWESALEAARHTEPIAWDRHWDGGSRRRAYEILVSIHPVRGRQMAFECLVSDLVGDWWYPSSVAVNLRHLAPLVCGEEVPAVEVWDVICRYLAGLSLAAHSGWDVAQDAPGADGGDVVANALTVSLCDWLDGRVPVMCHGAMRACVDLLLDGNGTIQSALRQKLDAKVCDATTLAVLMVLEAVGRCKSEAVGPFRECILELAQSPDQGVRWAAVEVGKCIGVDVVSKTCDESVLRHYDGRAVIQLPPQLVGVPERDYTFETVPDSLDPYETIAPWAEAAVAIAERAGLPGDAVVLRVVDYMRELSPEGMWNADAEHALRGRLAAAELKLPFRRPRAAIALRALHHVVRELLEGGMLSARVMEELRRDMRHYDAEMLVFRPERRPDGITGVAGDTFGTEWVEEVAGSVSWSRIKRLGEWRVIGERTVIKPAGERGPQEVRQVGAFPASWGFPSTHMDDSNLFARLRRQTHESYREAGESGAACVVLHRAAPYDTPGDEWMALDPVMARRLGWRRADSGLFAWRRRGTAMGRSVWWSDGLVEQSMEFWKKCEVAEGWLVVVSDEAFSELEAGIGAVTYCGSWTRSVFLKGGREKYARTVCFAVDGDD